jgi:hypothetical protein
MAAREDGAGGAIGAQGAAASAEAADVVLRVKRIDRLGTGSGIAHASWRIAVESALAGVRAGALPITARGVRLGKFPDRRRASRPCARDPRP